MQKVSDGASNIESLHLHIADWSLLFQGSNLLIGAVIIAVVLLFLFRPSVRAIAVRLVLAALIGLLLFWTYDYVQGKLITKEIQTAFVEPHDLFGTLIEVFGVFIATVYALLFAFMVLKSMQDFDSINFSLREEADNLEAISTSAIYLRPEWRGTNFNLIVQIHKLLIDYAAGVLSDEFHKRGFVRGNLEFIDSLADKIGQFKIENENDRLVVDKLISRLESLALLRSKRIAFIQTKPSPYMILMLFVLSVIVIMPFYIPVGNAVIMLRFFVGGLAFVLSFLFLMMLDMTSHFEGYWTVDREPFSHAKKTMDNRLRTLKKENQG